MICQTSQFLKNIVGKILHGGRGGTGGQWTIWLLSGLQPRVSIRRRLNSQTLGKMLIRPLQGRGLTMKRNMFDYLGMCENISDEPCQERYCSWGKLFVRVVRSAAVWDSWDCKAAGMATSPADECSPPELGPPGPCLKGKARAVCLAWWLAGERLH